MLVDEFKKTREEVERYPAEFIDRATAQKFAESVRGRLPTEAEWEYAARSSGLNCRWAGKDRVIHKTVPKSRLFSSEVAGDPVPMAVKSFPGEDETEQ